MLNHGIPVIVVSKILGHSKPSITMDIYGHLYNEMQDEAAQLMDEIVTPVQVELPKDRVVARSRQATKQTPHDDFEIASPGKERRVRNDSFFQQEGRPGAVGLTPNDKRLVILNRCVPFVPQGMLCSGEESQVGRIEIPSFVRAGSSLLRS
jgi:hypothetical protein